MLKHQVIKCVFSNTSINIYTDLNKRHVEFEGSVLTLEMVVSSPMSSCSKLYYWKYYELTNPEPASPSCCRSSSPRCSQEAAVRFTSWLWDRTRCSTGNNWTCYSGINWWRPPSLLWVFLVVTPFYICAGWCSSPWIVDTTQRSTKHSWIHSSVLSSFHVNAHGSTANTARVHHSALEYWRLNHRSFGCSDAKIWTWNSAKKKRALVHCHLTRPWKH